MQDLEKIIKESSSKGEVLKKLNMAASGANYKTLRRKIETLKIDISHFDKNLNRIRGKRSKIPIELCLVENSSYSYSNNLKTKLLKEGYLKYECVICKNSGEWQGKKISLHLDHINGIRNDNRLENLRILCPNCHSQTETYGSKRLKKHDKLWQKTSKKCSCCNTIISDKSTKCFECSKDISKVKPIKEWLEQLVYMFSIIEIGKIYGVTDNTVRKWCKGYKINYKIFHKGFWQKQYHKNKAS